MINVSLDEKSLWSKIAELSQAYYEGNPIVSDAEFDDLYDEFKKLYPESEYLKQPAKGFDVNSSALQKFAHKYDRVGSLEKIHHTSELDLFGNTKYSLSSKLDGSTMVLYFVNGRFERALTRGDGQIGLDVTNKAVLICNNLDNYFEIDGKPFTGAIRGEVVMSKDSFEKYKILHPEAKMARNVSTGVLNRKDNFEEDCKYIDYVTYKILANEDVEEGYYNIDYIRDQLEIWGFKVVSHMSCDLKCLTDEKMLDVFKSEYFSKYPTDGLVLTENICHIQSNGAIAYNEIAYKFAAESKEATVTDVTWELSRTGKMVPVINIAPIELSGAIVRNVSGFNYKYIMDNKIGPGSVIKVMRSGEVIPYVTDILTESSSMNIPTVCPECGEPLSLSDTGVNLVCNNPKCYGASYNNAYRFIEIMCQDVKGIGPAVIEHTIDIVEECYKLISDVDVFNFFNEFNVEEVCEYETPLMFKLLCEIEKIMRGKWDKQRFIESMNIPGVGKTIAANIVNSGLFDEIYSEQNDDKLYSIIHTKLTNVVADSLYKNLYRLRVYKFDKFIASKVINKFVTVTGSLSVPRKEFEKFLAEHGYGLTDNLNKSSCLITNDPNSGSSKNKKAKEYGVAIVTEEGFRNSL